MRIESRTLAVPKALAPPLEFEEVYQQHVSLVARWTDRLGGNRVDVEEVVQDVFMVVSRRLASYQPQARLTTWLYRITDNVVRRHRRRAWIRRWLVFPGRDLAERIPGPWLNPLEDVEQRQIQQRVYGILDSMNARYRAVLVLLELEGVSGKEAAERMGIHKLDNLWVIAHRARLDFARRLQRLEREEAGLHE
jgi:RNA polymerase sigma-70 factor (ECF subfamily)